MNIFKILCAFTLMSSALFFELQAAEPKKTENEEDWEKIESSTSETNEQLKPIFSVLVEEMKQMNATIKETNDNQALLARSFLDFAADMKKTLYEHLEAAKESKRQEEIIVKQQREMVKPETQEVSTQTEQSKRPSWSDVTKAANLN